MSKDSIPKVMLSDPTSGKSVGASIVHVYERDEMPASTDAPTTRNLALVVFGTIPQASRIAVAVTDGTQVLFLVEAAHLWFDVRGNRIGVRRVAS